MEGFASFVLFVLVLAIVLVLDGIVARLDFLTESWLWTDWDRVLLDPARLSSRGLDAGAVAAAIPMQNAAAPAGEIEEGDIILTNDQGMQISLLQCRDRSQ